MGESSQETLLYMGEASKKLVAAFNKTPLSKRISRQSNKIQYSVAIENNLKNTEIINYLCYFQWLNPA